MKTIQELNSRWYWRLIRVLYLLIGSAVILGIITSGFLDRKTIFDSKIKENQKTIVSSLLKKEYTQELIFADLDRREADGEFDYKFNSHDTVKFIESTFPGILITILILILLRGSTYYIILGKFNPDK